jgi:hypothetical protein
MFSKQIGHSLSTAGRRLTAGTPPAGIAVAATFQL